MPTRPRKQPWFYYFQIAFFLAVGLFLYLRLGFIGEWVEGLAIGLIAASFSDKWQKLFTWFFLAAVVIASIFDPVVKPLLDPLLHVNTVSGWWQSIVANVPFFAFYLGGLWWGKRMLGKMKK